MKLVNILRKDFLVYDDIFNSLVESFSVSSRSIYRALKDLLNIGFIDYCNCEKRYIILIYFRGDDDEN